MDRIECGERGACQFLNGRDELLLFVPLINFDHNEMTMENVTIVLISFFDRPKT